MSDHRKPTTPFPEELISGYIDGQLTQAEEQKVRLRLESDPQALRLYEQLREVREASLATPFRAVDSQWDERPRGGLSRLLRGLGLLMVLLAALVALGLAVVQPADDLPRWASRALVGDGVLGTALLLLGAFIDRRWHARRDIYSAVRK